MNLKSFGIANFKAFGQSPQSIPIKPITLVFGPNSAGKSSLLHSIQWMDHALNLGELDVRYPKAGKNEIDLGGFSQVIHDHASTPRIIAELTFGKETVAEELRKVFSIKTGISLDLSFGYQPLSNCPNPALLDYRLKIDGEDFLSIIRTKAGLKISNFDWCHKPDEELSSDEEMPDSNSEGVNELLNALRQMDKLTLKEAQMIQEAVSSSFFAGDELLASTLLPVGIKPGPRPTDETGKNLVLLLNRLLLSVAEEAQDAFKGLKYVPPLRKIPARYFDLTEAEEAWQRLFEDRRLLHKVNDWLRSETFQTKYELVVAEYLSRSSLERELPTLLRMEVVRTAVCHPSQETALSEELAPVIADLKELYMEADIESILRSFPDLLEDLLDSAADTYASDREHTLEAEEPSFKRMTHAEIRKLSDARFEWSEWVGREALEDSQPFATELFIRWASEQPPLLELFDRNEDNDPSYASREFLKGRAFGSRDVRREILLRHRHKNTDVSLQDVGVGISQVLPVILHAFGEKEKLIAIEQPEIHIHPALQAELGDVFIESALGENKNTFLLETHSEHLILRLLRRVRETTKGDFSEWPEALKVACPNGIRPEDIAVLYVQPGNEGAEITELPVTPDGDFSRPWPSGFFTERAKELY